MLPALPDHALTELGRTEGGPQALALLVRAQDTRRLLTLRAVLDAVTQADPRLCPPPARRRLREDWALMEAADATTSRPADSPARARLLHPLVGPWVQRCLTLLRTDPYRPGAQERSRQLAYELAHFSALAAAAAARAGLPFTIRLTARGGVIGLPSLGTLRTSEPDGTTYEVACKYGQLKIRGRGSAPVVVRLERGTGAWSDDPAWTPAHALPGLTEGAAPTPLDDLDPYRAAEGGAHYRGASEPATLDDAERKRWLQAWSGTAVELRLGGEQRLAEAVALLRCLVPLTAPPGSDPYDATAGTCSGTRREAFGAVLSSTPPTAPVFAATLVHELQHTKLLTVAQLVPLHRAGGAARYFAPWRPDPRPFDGLLQGAYSHLALADFFQRRALSVGRAAERESAWAVHARCKEQVGAALPAVVGSTDLTPQGRRLVDQMVATYERLGEHPAPRGHAARARAYVDAARTLFAARRMRSTG
ncbi:HEXXH motif-containing putative peptide modification protein [Streptomyces sp. NPDC059897]|uniref:aKG-HExxH-type peptide beta-hydroxylase n=1 Tax=Streptomyces sp. NPDC059897 TaxID=3346994 RepID=UPI00365A9E3E